MAKRREIIYLAMNISSGRIYIGKTKFNLEKRKREHERSAVCNPRSVFHKAIRGYGAEKFLWVELADNTEIHVDELERQFIRRFREEGYCLYNITEGGTGGDPKVYNIPKWKETMQNKTEEEKREYSEKMRKVALEKGYGKWMGGKVYSLERKATQRAAIQKALQDEEKRQRISHKGERKKPFSDEHRKKLGLLHKGKPKSKEHRRKLSEALKAKYKRGELISPFSKKWRRKNANIPTLP